jgi:hypothetical protein
MTINRHALRGSRARCTAADQIIAKGSTTQMAIRLAIFCSVLIGGDEAGECSFDMPPVLMGKRFQIRKPAGRDCGKATARRVANA